MTSNLKGASGEDVSHLSMGQEYYLGTQEGTQTWFSEDDQGILRLKTSAQIKEHVMCAPTHEPSLGFLRGVFPHLRPV